MFKRLFKAVIFYIQILKLKGYEEQLRKYTAVRASLSKKQKDCQRKYEDLYHKLTVKEGEIVIRPENIIK